MNIVEKYTFTCGIIKGDIERALYNRKSLYAYIKVSFTDVSYFNSTRRFINKETLYKI